MNHTFFRDRPLTMETDLMLDKLEKWVKMLRVPDMFEEVPESIIQELVLEASKAGIPKTEAWAAVVEVWFSWS